MINTVDEIKKKIDIVDFIGSYITLQKSGRNFKAVCPFHQEKTPSFVVSPERQIWHCFGSCGDGGDIVKFLMKWENITFPEALKELAEKAGIKIEKTDYEDKAWKTKERLISMHLLAAEFYEYVLNKNKFGEKGLDYLRARGIKREIAKKFQLGYSPASWNSLRSFLKKKKYSDSEMIEGGLALAGSSGGVYDRFRGRLMFPLKDARGNVVGFAGRSLEESVKEAKYINSPETPIYHKRESLFGIDLAKDAIKKEKNVFLVEGEFDVITPYQHGFANFVAIKGSAVTKEQLMTLRRYTDRITLALDADVSGEEAMKRGIEEAEGFELEVEVVTFSSGKDPDEAIRNDLAAFKNSLKNKQPIYDFIIDSAAKKLDTKDPFSKKNVGDEIIPVIERIKNPIVQAHYVKKVADLLDVTEGSINASIKQIRQKKKQRQFLKTSVKSKDEDNREIKIQKFVLSILFQSKKPYELADKYWQVLSKEDFTLPSFQKILVALDEYRKKNPKDFKVDNFDGVLEPELRVVYDEIYLYASYDAELEKITLEKLLYEVKRNSVKQKITYVMNKEENKKGNEELRVLGNTLKEVEKKLISL